MNAAPMPVATSMTFASRRGLGLALVSAASVIATSTAGRIISRAPVAGWYTTIAKPSFNPPNWVFPVAWTLLFTLMGIAFWRILRRPPGTTWRAVGVALFVGQLFLNVGWSAAFFGAHSPLLGLIVIVPFWGMILATAVVFAKVDRAAGWLLAPYLAWVSFATLLNATIVHLN